MNVRGRAPFVGRYSNSLQTIFSPLPRVGLEEQIAPKNHAAAGHLRARLAEGLCVIRPQYRAKTNRIYS
jgi:hypothetical protein